MNRGSILDVFFVGIFAVVLVIFGLIMYYWVDVTTTASIAAGQSFGADSNMTMALAQTKVAANNFVNTIGLIIAFAGIAAIAAAYFIPANPIFFPIGILLLLVALVFFYNLQQVLPQIFQSSFFAPLAAQFPIQVAIAENVAWVVLAVGSIMLVVLYGRIRAGGTPEG